jgi:hypothetical protein
MISDEQIVAGFSAVEATLRWEFKVVEVRTQVTMSSHRKKKGYNI